MDVKILTAIVLLNFLNISQTTQMMLIKKRDAASGDVSYSYAATDIDLNKGAHVKTLTVIKNVGVPTLKKHHQDDSEIVDKPKVVPEKDPLLRDSFHLFKNLFENSELHENSHKKTDEKKILKEALIKPEALKQEKPVEIKKDAKKEKHVEEVKEIKAEVVKPEKAAAVEPESAPVKLSPKIPEELLLLPAEPEYKSKEIDAYEAALSHEAQKQYWISSKKSQSDMFSDYLNSRRKLDQF